MDLDFKGKAVSTIGTPVSVGEKFPDFTVLDKDNKSITLDSLLDKPLLISVVPDIDTRICSLQTKHFNQEIDGHTEINFVTISKNTIEEQSNWCAAENVKNMKMLSDTNHDFGEKSKLFIPDLGILARSVWFVDTNKQVLYSEILKVQATEPNYDKVLDQVDQMN
ncbi:thiol peroxidase [Companilactobacillus allii]|uniref:Lipid hydroperoxide peroxidase n=1 Tax=Companilactobacillus allii TaxID=1847728 RepID=A0A1P8Q2G1_9LACO|nr:thiol peroxidase [Companilactobacillus allii]APX72025.1 lipid hydroperoxide peroxidase [Companilactobacillus allii]USQ69118.1 thiol peroxidase [Companilactobacillus allii]